MKMNLRVTRWGVVGGTVWGTLGTLGLLPSLAIGATPDAVTTDSDAIPEIVITANKISSSEQSLPSAVTVVSGDQLVAFGVSDLNNVSQLAPSLSIEPVRAATNIFLRGIGSTLTSPNADPAVAVNVNGAYVPSEMSGVSFFDIDRVEVLPGPQGTLYGRNAAGGVINLITRRPGDEYSAEGFVEYGNFQRVQVFAAVDTPLSDTFSIRTAISVIEHNGYFSNGLDDQDTIAGRVTALWKPSSATTVTAIVSYDRDQELGNIAQNVPPPGGQYWNLSFNPRALGYNTGVEATTASLQVDQTLAPSLSLTYVGGYNHLISHQDTGFYAGPPPPPLGVQQSALETSQEVRLNGDFGPLKGIVGAYYFYQQADYFATFYPVPVVYLTQGPFVAESKGEALFTQWTYSLSDAWRVTGGLRESYTEKSIDGQDETAAPGGPPNFNIYDGHNSFTRTDWKVGLEYDVTSASMLYGNVSTGASPGGFSTSAVAPNSTQAAQFEPMKVTAYTLGIKNRLFGNTVTANFEGFYYDYDNYQVSQRNPQTGQNEVYNAAKAEVYGAEADIAAKITKLDSLNLSLAYVHATAITLVTPAGNFDGYTLPYSPEWTANLSYQHKFLIADGSDVTALLESQYTSEQWGFYTHATDGLIASNTRTNADLTYHAASGHWSVSLWGRNLENKIVYTSGIADATPGPAAFFASPPRTFGLRASFKY